MSVAFLFQYIKDQTILNELNDIKLNEKNSTIYTGIRA